MTPILFLCMWQFLRKSEEIRIPFHGDTEAFLLPGRSQRDLFRSFTFQASRRAARDDA